MLPYLAAKFSCLYILFIDSSKRQDCLVRHKEPYFSVQCSAIAFIFMLFPKVRPVFAQDVQSGLALIVFEGAIQAAKGEK